MGMGWQDRPSDMASDAIGWHRTGWLDAVGEATAEVRVLCGDGVRGLRRLDHAEFRRYHGVPPPVVAMATVYGVWPTATLKGLPRAAVVLRCADRRMTRRDADATSRVPLPLSCPIRASGNRVVALELSRADGSLVALVPDRLLVRTRPVGPRSDVGTPGDACIGQLQRRVVVAAAGAVALGLPGPGPPPCHRSVVGPA
ncbi:hypothetical protein CAUPRSCDRAFT_12160 [Caulochytrium protostelioides]|uniref:Uncharacterized protein n=1 Tax=Caulochytrium protostelioides TaxID=1555241 RepID=A0A4P9WV19_9FUNG|nr:hypothetical protein CAUPRSCDRAFT_12160 [Caulochytrium protostelioides]